MSESELVHTSLDQGVFTITLDRPKVNAFNFEMIAAVQQAFKQAAKDAQVRSVLFSASGSVFSAGQDITEFKKAAGAGEISFRQHLQRTYNPLVVQIRQLEKPVIAAIQGAVSGAAMGLALACDLRIAAQSARFVFGFLGIGLAADSAVSRLLPALIGLGRASEAAFTNQPIDAKQALAWGLVNRVVLPSQLPHHAFAWAAELAHGPIHAMGLIKREFNRAVLHDLEAILDYEAHIQEIAGKGAEHREGLQAFLEKRNSDFTKGRD